MGRPKKSTTLLDRFEANVFYSPDGCHYWTGYYYPAGYGSIYAWGKIDGAHRVSFRLFKSEIPKGLQVLHKCDNRKCVNPDHLFLGTNADNVRDKVLKNRQYRPFGKKSPKAKLSNELVYQIREMQGVNSYKDVAKKFSVSPSHIHKIWRNEFWIQNHSNND